MRAQYDVILVGGGPSGTTCARELAARGASVLLVDKKSPGWHKPCGGGIPEVLFEPYGIPGALGFSTPKVRVRDAVQRLLTIPMRYRTVYRNRFDEHLAEAARAAGAEVLFDTMLLDVERDADGFTVRTSKGAARAKFLVGADGCMSTVRRKLFPEQLPESMCGIAVEHWYRTRHGITSLDFYVEPDLLGTGYAYVFPKDPELLVVGIAGIAVDKPRAVLEQLLARPRYRALVGDLPVAAVHGARIPYRHLSRLRDGRLILIGDAAGLNTPIIFAGIPIALHSGRIAGEAIAEALQTGFDAPLDRYSLASLRASSLGFQLCHAFYDELLKHRRPPSFATLARPLWRRPLSLPTAFVIHRALSRLVDRLDVERMAAVFGVAAAP
ncbi:FAD-dependent oxidoreductase [Nannocystis punicea]|uniref:NAD(P)/FAD-dependent oxidoreductase n=1 Tax=Nannocystis punicea TaxID=2995304 RepID=A0ABY7GWK6_9BACT|nr:NAD(P)/FAD-dependent oxidoreductase [Nannocystis poenicansa]WAS91265.1 NAD(P)/FAD-dependent oxidoreductase [Nannocystis poenicansa]